MKIYRNSSTDPYFNLAAEEYLLTHTNEPCFMLWQNTKSVIIGRNQNAYAEIDPIYTEANGIKVVRRLTGGGAVFHDIGNINYTFISPKIDDHILNFAHFSDPILNALKSLGINATLSGRNDILVDGKKISGNAQCVKNDNILHHGTLLFSADLSAMQAALRVNPDKLKSKGIKSVRSRVTNLSQYLPPMSVFDFIEHIYRFINGRACEFSEEERKNILLLAKEKYQTWEWNFGSSKTFSKKNQHRFDNGTVELSYDSGHGILEALSIRGDFFSLGEISRLEESLVGCRLEHTSLLERIESSDVSIAGISSEDLLKLFFE